MECTIWTGPVSQNGKPISTHYKRKRFYIQRRAYEDRHGVTLGNRDFVATSCRNRLCVTPEHVVLVGTIEHFWSRIDVRGDDDCWPWLKGQHTDGYGRYVMGGRSLNAHRIAWESVHGPIPDGLVIDHLCRNRTCQNPRHMEPVSAAENVRRGTTNTGVTCKKGHPLPLDWSDQAPNGRHCPTCRAASNARFRARVASGEHVPVYGSTCAKGHDREGQRQCPTCRREYQREWARRKRRQQSQSH